MSRASRRTRTGTAPNNDMPMVDFADSALGMIETRGLVAAIEAADAMVKTSEVTIVSVEQTIAALITIHVIGETAAVIAAVEAGRAAAERIGEVVSAHVIPRPDGDVASMILEEAGILGRKGKLPPVVRKREVPGTSGPRNTPQAGPGRATHDLGTKTVQELRRIAREIPDLPLQGREIARANKKTLIDLIKKHLG